MCVGCAAPVDLLSAPIVGGTLEQQQLVAEEVAAFDEDVGPGRVRVRRVELRDLGDELAGTWRHGSKVVELDVSLSDDRLREVTRHELCHALSTYEPEHVSTGADLLDTWAARVPEDVADANDPREEAFASSCALGEWAARLLSQGCPSDPDDWLAALMAFERDAVWEATPLQATWSSDDSVAFVPGGTVGAYLVRDTTLDRTIEVVLDQDEGSTLLWVDLDTAEPLEEWDPGQDVSPPLLDESEFVAGAVVVAPVTGWAAGPRHAVARVDTPLGTIERRLYAFDEPWRLLRDGCHGPPDLFFADEVGYLTETDGIAIRWAPLAP